MKARIIRRHPVPFILAVLFSLAFHFVALAHMKGIGFPDAFSTTLFITSIEKEGPYKAFQATSIREILRKDRRAGKGTRSSEQGERNQVEKEDSESLSGADEKLSNQEGTAVIDDKQEASKQVEKTEVAEDLNNGEPQPEGSGERPAESLTFKERLYFNIYWLGIYVGNASIGAAIHDGNVTITSQVHSAPFISNFYQVEDYAESTIIDNMPVSFRIKQHEGKYRSNKETLFDITNQKITYVDYLKDLKTEHILSVPVIWDVISGFYYLRAQSLDVGKTVFIDVFDSNKFLSVEVDVLRKEKILLFDKREIDTIIVKPILRSEGLFQKKGDIFIWLTDDEVRIPVRVETEVPVGKVVVELNGMESEK